MRMIVYKEWLKLRPYLLLAVAANLLFAVWLFLSMRQRFATEHAEMLFYQANHIGYLFYDDLRYLPLILGVGLAMAQFMPEIIRGRLRLAMHLPIGLARLVLGHLAVGLATLAVLLAMNLAAVVWSVGTFFPGAFVESAVVTAAPWLLAGIAGYLGGALVLLEPDRRFQAANLAVAAGVVALCHLSAQYDAYDRALWGLAALVALLIPATLLQAHRFRNGGRA